MNILIVDDNPINLKLLRAQLEAEGYAVFEAPNGVDALALLERQRVDVLISDIFMPEMDGYRLCYEIRKHARLHDLPIILCTSTYTSVEDEKLVRDVRADKYLRRPVSLETIVAAVHEVKAMGHAAPQPKAMKEAEVLMEYSERLVSKLEEKNTELQTQTEALRASEERYRLLFERAPDVIFSLAPMGAIVTLNRGFETITGWPRAQWLGRPFKDLLHPDDQTLAGELFRLVLGGEPAPTFVLRVRTVAGGFRDVEFTGFSSELSGGRIEVQGIGRDITERLQSEAALREREARLRAIIDNEPECVKVVDKDGLILEMNPAGLRMIEADSFLQVQNEGINSVIVEEHRAAFSALLRKTFQGESGMLEFDIIGLKGTRHTLDTHAVPLRDERGEVAALLGITRDITERKQAQEEIVRLNTELEDRVRRRTAQLQMANQELEAFSYSVSHDLRSPLSTINGFGDLLSKEIDACAVSDRGKHYLARIRAGVVQMGELIDALLSLAQVSRTSLGWESVDLSAMAETVLNAYRERDPDRVAQLAIQPGLVVQGDPRLLRQVLDNLLGNAWKFSGKQKQPLVSFKREMGTDGAWVYAVRDNGAGFDMAYSEKLFSAFQRFHTASEFEGTGIGLATVYRIITRHGGKVWAESAPHQGATFYFTLGGAPA
ncbi:MAG: PAS domain S-box protein [Polaromonas sp.]|uniref:PAS domain S-box protein n=1 Tax=Polaromonas sp. TaxID=1869339 RepID=UPI00248987D9|nr:PAS domain S-box protein [Polaromonas sp.]MDI1269487.1 PAS domain S-box protein [Polaromonas sp.]